jgi:hypothetical protein
MKKILTWEGLGWFLTGVLTFMLGFSGVSKVIGTDEMVKTFEFLKLTPYMKWIGIGEIIGLILLIYPRTSIYGAVLLSSFMSGAVALHMSLMNGASVMVPVMLGVLAWSSHCLRTYMGQK